MAKLVLKQSVKAHGPLVLFLILVCLPICHGLGVGWLYAPKCISENHEFDPLPLSPETFWDHSKVTSLGHFISWIYVLMKNLGQKRFGGMLNSSFDLFFKVTTRLISWIYVSMKNLGQKRFGAGSFLILISFKIVTKLLGTASHM